MKRLTLQEAMNLSIDEIDSMSASELRRAIAPIRDAINKRMKRLEKASLPSPALAGINKTGGRIYVGKEMSEADLKRELERGMAFIGYKTSTVSGTKQYISARNKGKVKYESMNASQIGKYWDVVHKLKQSGSQLDPEYYNEAQDLIRQAVMSDDPEEEMMMRLPEESHEAIEKHRKTVSHDEKVPIDERLADIYLTYQDWNMGLFDDEEGEEEL